MNTVPRLYGALVLVFPPTALASTLDNILPHGTSYTQHNDCFEAVLAEVREFYSYEIDDLLTHLFARCDLEKIHYIIISQQAKVLIDISFHHYETFPALVFEGKNMEIIHKLKANISIDPY